jgi:hypothetical protein
LARELGPRLLSIKRAGVWVRPDLAAALSGRPASLRLRLKAAALSAAARSPALMDRLRGANRALRRWRAALTA